MPANKVFKVIEASNPARNELYLFATDSVVIDAIAAFRKSPPPAVEHWRSQLNSLAFRSVVFDVSYDDACDIIADMLRFPPPTGWHHVIHPEPGEGTTDAS